MANRGKSTNMTNNEPPKKTQPELVRTNITIERDLLDDVHRKCVHDRMSMSSLISRLLSSYLNGTINLNPDIYNSVMLIIDEMRVDFKKTNEDLHATKVRVDYLQETLKLHLEGHIGKPTIQSPPYEV